jgi:uncharacterized RDD family membrane protein YckC
MTAAVGAAGARAGFVSRLGALIADMIILWVGLHGTVWLLRMNAEALRRFAPPVSLGTLVIFCSPVIASLYKIVCWRLSGQTPGKWLLGVRVVAIGGGRVSIGRAAIRVAGYLVSALPFYLGFFWVLGPARRGFHDYLAGTEVVYERRPAPGLPSSGPRPLVPRRLSAH